MRFGRLVTIGQLPLKRRYAKRQWRCLCSCGQESAPYASALLRGTQSCGCRVREATIRRNTVHGLHGTREYNAWLDMKKRCGQHARSAKDYWQRGIGICERWSDFQQFLADMGECPPGLSLDRIENERGYEPGNCRWATRVQQNNNSRRNHRIDWGGRTMTMAQWASELCVPVAAFRQRVWRNWPLERVMTQPYRGETV